jgi:MFS transporter, PPP family, 3-phenylpropionic acid transporter
MQARPLLRFIVLYGAMYSAFGVASPFMPELVRAHGLRTEQLGAVLAAGMVVRMATASLAGRIGDAFQALRGVLVVCAALAGVITLLYLPARGALALLAVTLVQAAALAPIATLADALALDAASQARRPGRRGFEYGWVRGTGSLAFVVGTLIAGQAVGLLGFDVIIWLQAPLLIAAALAARAVPEAKREATPTPRRADGSHHPAHLGVLVLLRLSLFRRVIAVAALVLGSHALHDAFAVIRWTHAGVSPATVSVLWSASVVSEVVVFFVVGPAVLKRFPPALALACAALAGIVRWIVSAYTTAVVALALVQPLHGLTFSLLHLACMRLLAIVVPAGLEGTAQAIYGTVAIGGTSALLTLSSGVLYARFDAHAFWFMAGMCALAFVPVWLLRKVRA